MFYDTKQGIIFNREGLIGAVKAYMAAKSVAYMSDEKKY